MEPRSERSSSFRPPLLWGPFTCVPSAMYLTLRDEYSCAQGGSHNYARVTKKLPAPPAAAGAEDSLCPSPGGGG